MAELMPGRKKVLKWLNKHLSKVKRNTFLLIISITVFSCSGTLSKKETELFTEKGNLIVKKTAEELSGTLTAKMKDGGIPMAVEYCNIAALPLTSEISEIEHVSIKRTSLKIRNPQNSPNEEEIEVMNMFLSMINKSKAPKPVVKLDESGKPHYYAPILIDAKCLMCHGTLDRELSKKADSIIKTYYPKDLATGFKEGDLRGIWSISFP